MALLLLLSGCLLRSPERLYALPRQSESYNNLQSAIEEIVTDDIVYCSPTSGENQQPLQIRDLNGDGKNEALVFAKTEGERPLKIYIFSQTGDQFSLVSTIEGSGSGFDSVQYAQMDNLQGMEIIVGRRVNDQVVKSLSVYALRENSSVELLSTNYSTYTLTDLDGDGQSDLFLIRPESDQEAPEAELYRCRDGIVNRDPGVMLSCTSIRRVATGYADEALSAVFVAGTADNNATVTDVFIVRDGVLRNIATGEDATNMTARSYAVYAVDIDGDGLVELPEIETLKYGNLGGDQNVIRWYNLRSNGTKSYKMLTYHDFAHGFYMPLDITWLDSLSIEQDTRVTDGTAYRFSLRKGGNRKSDELFTLYLFSGDEREELAGSDGRFLLADKNDIVYAASIGSTEKITEDQLRQRFQFIRTDWQSDGI